MKRTLFLVGAVAVMVVGGQVLRPRTAKRSMTKSCKGCHTAMKPKTGDKAAWVPLIKQGEAALTASVMKGKTHAAQGRGRDRSRRKGRGRIHDEPGK